MESEVSDNFARISGNFMKHLKKLKQLLKKFCGKFAQVKCGQILIETHPQF